jgi:methylenetetrahydrofolate reductase (NADPH)
VARSTLAAVEREALKRALASPKLEVLPLPGVLPQLAGLEAGETLAVTASPAKGLETSLEMAEGLRREGFGVVVHLAARMVADRAHLDRLLGRMEAAGLDRAFVIGGDASPSGAYPDALALLRALAVRGHHLAEIGIACHPQGHPDIPDDVLLAALEAKAPFADYMTTQLCFDASALSDWISARRGDGLTLPVDIGVAGAVDVPRLLRISMRVGVTDAARFVSRQGGLLTRLLRPGGYRPDRLLHDLAPTLADPAAGVRGLHVFTFNQVDQTEAWRRRRLAEMGGRT